MFLQNTKNYATNERWEVCRNKNKFVPAFMDMKEQ